MSSDTPANNPISALFDMFAAANKALTTLPPEDTTRQLSDYLMARCKTMMELPFPVEGKRTTLVAWAGAVGAESTITQAEWVAGRVLPHHYGLRMNEISRMTIALTEAQLGLVVQTLRP